MNYKEKLNLQVQYNLLSTNKTEWYLLLRATFLAHQLKSQAASQLIPQIYNNNDLIANPIQMNIFKIYFSFIYFQKPWIYFWNAGIFRQYRYIHP